jgi:hypothetical protein
MQSDMNGEPWLDEYTLLRFRNGPDRCR